MAADTPSRTKNSVYIQPRSNWVQSQLGGEQGVAGDGELAEEGGGVAGAGDRLAGSCGHADGAAERQPEHAEAVGHADAEMDGERGRRDQPAVIVRRAR